MKKSCSHNCITFFLIFSLGFCLNLDAKVDTLTIDSNFTSVNLKSFSKVNGQANHLKADNKSYFYFSFNNSYNSIDFTIKNKLEAPRKLILQLSYVYIKEIIFCKYEDGHLIPLSTTGIEHKISTKPIEHRLFTFPIHLNPGETASYQLKLKKEKGKPLATSILLKNEKTFTKQNFIQQIIIGSYFGVSLLSVVFSLFIFSFLRKSTYLIYAAYVIFLGLFISAYIGVFSQIFLRENSTVNKYAHYVIFSEISLILFALFSQKILETKTYTPKLKKYIEILLGVVIVLRLALHFVFTHIFESAVSIFMKIWYAFFIILISIIIIQIVIYYRKNNKRTSLFALAYIFMILGTMASILYHSYGVINTYFYDLPLLFYTSFLEILFLTFTVVFMVKDIYDERNVLSEKIVIEEKKNLTAFIKGEDQERKRIGKELHDNIGSQLSYLKRFVSDKFKDEKVTKTIDTICNDVRNLSHEISPSDLKIVGFKDSVEDLSKTLSNQTSLEVSFSNYQFPEIIGEEMATQLYRVVQEAFNNILKHANAKHVDVQLMGHDDAYTISIEDDGDGFNVSRAKNGLGLKNMKSRIQQVGGTLSIDSDGIKGTSILISIPK
ncbi:hypothetical protein EYD45_08205 [Hyunsoonleella flava]|uniref:histidine kinase n=1 Tax=Hyunsoonleella flava TaxID=2527939 RepID=A0A4Q9FDY7_9FLAO|nr:7TM diverse intracellular signaling domain-containing protein [Hyunsoonleella flava]TBN03986.1 hypothetical protein EYD45_08205 [Hyunsoonleella flava]